MTSARLILLAAVVAPLGLVAQAADARATVGDLLGPPAVKADALQPAPVPVKRLQPRYPLDAYRNGVSGQVSLKIFVASNGRVTRVEQLGETPRGHGFFLAAVYAVNRWVFTPAQTGIYRVDLSFDHATATPPAAPPPNAGDLDEALDPLRSSPAFYPPRAAAIRLEGEVELVITIGTDLDVVAAAVVSEDPVGFEFADRALDSAYSMTFPAGTSPGQYRATVTFDCD